MDLSRKIVTLNEEKKVETLFSFKEELVFSIKGSDKVYKVANSMPLRLVRPAKEDN